jgi:cyclic pyranopterin phosphate synthase
MSQTRAIVDYLRISITDRCNERCLYCMPEGFKDWKERSEILSYEEIIKVVRATAKLGFRKFRITGGEPLLRKGVVDLIQEMSAIQGVESISMTTNGTQLAPLARDLRKAGLKNINISLDALSPEVYRKITHGDIQSVLEGIQAAINAGFERIKLNMVLIRGMNEQEIWPIIHFAAERNLILRFIELMPVSVSEMLIEKNFLPIGEVQQMISDRDPLSPQNEHKFGHGPAHYYTLENLGSTLGFIGAMTNLHFCESCNKIRLTADGHIRPCLGNHGEYDLKPSLRETKTEASLLETIQKALSEKPPEHLFRNNYQPSRIMTAIGG